MHPITVETNYKRDSKSSMKKIKSGVLHICLMCCPRWTGLLKKRRAARRYFSQFGEDVVLKSLLHGRQDGFYVDCGAFDPFIFSNTALFYEMGWSGINIEPQHARWGIFKAIRKRDINLCEVVSDASVEVDFVEHPTPTMSGISSTLARGDRSGVVRRLKARPLRDIFAEYAERRLIDFLTVDCEGHDLQVLRSNDWNRFRPSYVVVEDHAAISPAPTEIFMNGMGYKFITKLGPAYIFES